MHFPNLRGHPNQLRAGRVHAMHQMLHLQDRAVVGKVLAHPSNRQVTSDWMHLQKLVLHSLPKAEQESNLRLAGIHWAAYWASLGLSRSIRVTLGQERESELEVVFHQQNI